MAERVTNPYLDGVRTRRFFPIRRVLGLWVPAVVVVLVLSSLLSGRASGGVLLLDLLTVVASLALVLWARSPGGPAARVERALVGIDRRLLREDHAAALAELRALLEQAIRPFDRARALLQLGQVAEARGDFAEAAEVYGAAAAVLPVRRGTWGMQNAQVAPVIGVRRAFCLAAAGRLDEAALVLDAAHDRDELPGVRALSVRARALLLARRGEHQALVDLASREHVRIKNGLAYRDRALLRVLLGWGRSCVGGAFRAPPPPGLGEDAALRGWLARAVPEAANVLVSP